MNSLKIKLLSSSAIPVLVGAGIAVGGAVAVAGPGFSIVPALERQGALPNAKPRPGAVRLAACSADYPCAATNPCNPCAAKKIVANPCNPCAATNPCNPCAANPCNPCGPSGAVELTSTEAAAAYACLLGELKAAYAKAGLGVVKDYDRWTNANTAPYVSDTHGGRLVNNYANSQGGNLYVKFEDSGTMPAGSVLAKDSFVAQPDGRLAIGPLFVMEKMNDGFNAESGDWRYTMVMPDGSVFGRTKGAGAASVEFCNACHSAVAEDQGYMFFLPEEHRASF